MTLHQLTDEAREMYANAVGIPWQFWAGLVLAVIVLTILAWASTDYTHMTAEYVAARKAERDAQLADLCRHEGPDGAVCTLDPHPAGTKHHDATRGSRWHSVTWGDAA